MMLTFVSRLLTALLLCAASASFADDIVLIGTMGNKGVFQINGQKKTLQPGQESGTFKIISVQAESAIVSSNGQQRQLQLGQGYVASNSGSDTGGSNLILTPDDSGHYSANVTINQVSQRGLIDTGATHLSMSRALADSMRINYLAGRTGRSQTANGIIASWLVTLPQVKLGTITVYDVPMVVRDNDNGPLLIGTSLLNRFQMKRDQELMILSKKNY